MYRFKYDEHGSTCLPKAPRYPEEHCCLVCHVLNVVFLILGDSLASEFYKLRHMKEKKKNTRSIASFEGSQASTVFHLLRATCRWRHISRIDEMISTEENRNTVSNTRLFLRPPKISHALKRHWTRTSADSGQRLTAWAKAQALKTEINLNYTRRFSPYCTLTTLRLGYNNQSVNAV
jgi:hypothetical protein